MCHPVLFGLLAGIFAFKMMRRMSYLRHKGGGCGGGFTVSRWGGWGPGRRWSGHWGHGEHHGQGGGFDGGNTTSASQPIEVILQGLDLNQRQKEEAQPIFDRLAEFLGRSGPRLHAALLTIAAESFDRKKAEAIFSGAAPDVQKELPEGMEHVHNILIPEQREHLRGRLGTPAAS